MGRPFPCDIELFVALVSGPSLVLVLECAAMPAGVDIVSIPVSSCA